MATPVRERNKRGEGELLREALLDAASEILDETKDVEQLSVRAVTACAGVSPTALYLHFADKDDLARAVKKRCFAAFADALRAAESMHDGDGRAQLRGMGHAYLRFAREHPGHYALMFHTDAAAGKSHVGSAEVRSVGLESFGLLVGAVARCLGEGYDAFEAGCFMWLALHGRAALEQSMPWFPLPEEERYVAALVARNVGGALEA